MSAFYKKIFCDNIKFIIENYGFSDEKMCEIMKIGKGSLKLIKNGELPKRISVEVVFNISREVKIAPEKLLMPLQMTDLK